MMLITFIPVSFTRGILVPRRQLLTEEYLPQSYRYISLTIVDKPASETPNSDVQLRPRQRHCLPIDEMMNRIVKRHSLIDFKLEKGEKELF